MNNPFELIGYYLSYPFVVYSLIVCTLVSLCASLLGVTLVLKRYSFIGDGLSHVAFGATAVASIFNLTDNMYIVLPVTLISAIVILRSGQNAKLKGDAAIAMMSVGALAAGYLIINIFSTSANVSGDVCSTLFGSSSLLTLSMKDVIFTVVLSSIVMGAFIVLYNRIFSVTFDENFANASGVKTGFYNTVIAVIIAVIIVLGMRLVGSLLVSALIIFPSLSAMRMINNFRGVVILSAVFAILCALTGLFLSITFALPAGAAIVVVDIVVYFICCILGKIVAK